MPKKFITKKQEKGVLQEEMNHKLDIVLEYVVDFAKTKPIIEKLGEDMAIVKDKVSILEIGHKSIAQDIKEIKQELKQKADKKYVEAIVGLR